MPNLTTISLPSNEAVFYLIYSICRRMWRHELETLRALDLVRVGTHLAEFRLTEKEYLILLEQHREMKIRLEALLLAKATSE